MAPGEPEESDGAEDDDGANDNAGPNSDGLNNDGAEDGLSDDRAQDDGGIEDIVEDGPEDANAPSWSTYSAAARVRIIRSGTPTRPSGRVCPEFG